MSIRRIRFSVFSLNVNARCLIAGFIPGLLETFSLRKELQNSEVFGSQLSAFLRSCLKAADPRQEMNT